jgi:hypothetical protein
MFRHIEAPVSEWRPTRTHTLDEKISELQRVRSLIPTGDDFLKYSLTTKEVHSMFPSSYRIEENLRVDRYRNAANGVMVVLRKRDAENPEMPINYPDLGEAIRVLVDDEPYGNAALFAIDVLESNGLIDTDNWRYVSIVNKEPIDPETSSG